MKSINNKKYFFITLFLTVVYIIFIYFSSQINRRYILETNKFLRVPSNLKIINLGSSHGLFGIKYPKDTRGYNLSLVSQTMYYDAKILNKYKNHLSKNAVVIIPVSIFSFYNDKKLEERYYNFLNYQDIVNGKRKDEILFKNFSIFFYRHSLIRTIKYIFQSIFKGKMIPEDVEWSKKKLTMEELKNEAENTAKQHLENNKVYLEYVKEILNICQKNELYPVFITTPQSYLYNERIGKENYKKRIYYYMAKLKKEYDFFYLDYSHDKRFENNLEYFMDDDHLNEKGADYFTEILLKDIKEIIKTAKKQF